MKKIIAMLCCAAALTWAGCSDDDDTDKVDMSLLTGKWEVTKQYDGELDRWYENFGEASGFVQTIELRKVSESMLYWTNPLPKLSCLKHCIHWDSIRHKSKI